MLVSQFARLSRASAPLHFFPLHSFCHTLFYRIDRIIIVEIWGDEEIGQRCRQLSLECVQSPYCSTHDEWLIMKRCMHVGYHDANNVSTVDGNVVTQSNFKKRFKKVIRDFQRRSSILLQSARDRVATAAKTVTSSRLWSAMPVKQCT